MDSYVAQEIAEDGDMIMILDPNPLKNPLIPSSFAISLNVYRIF